MNIADRIQHLRKIKGISQEELADRLGASRQAVSKWENGQSLPDIDKLILMSDFFEVTTDYLLKGIEPVSDGNTASRQKPNAEIFTIVGTAANIMGVIIAAMVWHEEQTAVAFALGAFLVLTGCMVYRIGLLISDPVTGEGAKRNFWAVNVWVLTFMPLSLLYNFLTGGFRLAPYPIPVGGFLGFGLFWVVWLTVGAAVDFIVFNWSGGRGKSV